VVTRRISQIDWYICQNMAILTISPYHIHGMGDALGEKVQENSEKVAGCGLC
jgi:hypothetical protein